MVGMELCCVKIGEVNGRDKIGSRFVCSGDILRKCVGVVVIGRKNEGLKVSFFYSVDMRYLCKCYGDG